MKNLLNKSRLFFLLLAVFCSLTAHFVKAQNSGLSNCTITVTGTGKTTGDIVAMTIYNPTSADVYDNLGPCYIPSDGGYQPYIIPTIKPVTVPAGQTIRITLKGFCADISKPAVPEHFNLKPLIEWVKIEPKPTGNNSAPFSTAPNPDTNPAEAAPKLLEAIREISLQYDKLKDEGKIITPFSGNPEKEREAVIQQTFWIYTSNLRQKPYVKEDLKYQTYKQFEEKSNINPVTLPKEQKEKMDKGIDDFWSTFNAVGTAAKVLNSTKPEDKPYVPTISGPEVKPCDCGECRLIEGQGIGIYLDKYGEPFTGDSIPWSINQVFIDRPDILSTCTPSECPPTRDFEIRTTITYKDKKWPAPPAIWKQYDFTRESPVMEHQGEMLIEFRYKCFCAGKQCSEGTTSRKLYFIEKNNCCDSIRLKNGGILQFNFNSGSAVISGNKLTISMTGAKPEVFDFNFNLEAIFCNLSTDQVFSQLVSIMSSQTKAGQSPIEFSSAKNTGMGGPSTDPNMAKYYGFSFSKRVNDKEISIYFSMDKKTCSYDVSVLFEGKLYEYAAPPYLSPAQLQSMTWGLTSSGQQQYWVNALLILSHLARADDYKMGQMYDQAFRSIMGAISTQAGNLMTNPQYAAINKQLGELISAIKQALGKGGFNDIGNVMQKMMPVINFLGK